MTTQERPLVLKAPQVLALLNGATQLRVPVKPTLGPEAYWIRWEGYDCWRACGLIGDIPGEWRSKTLYSRFSNGDRFWVKETWSHVTDCGHYNHLHRDSTKVLYKADGDTCPTKWRAAGHLPRWASRIFREVVSVRVERVQDISDADAEASGAQLWSGGQITPADMYSGLWEESYGPGSWDRNEWCWVYEIKEAPCSKS